jgi:iron-sulfur cluster repair protein YtfE (RIC family)
MGRSRVAAAIVMLALVASLAACCGGSTTVEKTVEKTPVNVQTQTTGDQLIDLQKAYQSGAINEQQYNKMKQDIIDKSGEK